VLRRWFEALHDVTGDGAWYRAWIVEKSESGIAHAGAMAHGGSALRYEPMYEEEIETEDQYDDSGFSYELEECDLDLDEGIVLVSTAVCVN
jgi:hypothetical protein